MGEWFLPRMAMEFACWDLTNSAVNLLTAYPKKPVLCGWSVLCILIRTWYWQQNSLQHTVRLPQGALADESLCISQSFRHNLHQIRNCCGTGLDKLLPFRWSIFLEDLIKILVHMGPWISLWSEYLVTSVQPASEAGLHAAPSWSALLHSCCSVPLNTSYFAW